MFPISTANLPENTDVRTDHMNIPTHVANVLEWSPALRWNIELGYEYFMHFTSTKSMAKLDKYV